MVKIGNINIKGKVVLAPMAGICNGDFAVKLIPYGFDTVTLGGFNIDKYNILDLTFFLHGNRPVCNDDT